MSKHIFKINQGQIVMNLSFFALVGVPFSPLLVLNLSKSLSQPLFGLLTNNRCGSTLWEDL
ncbi:MAG: hypothetical protein U5N85_22060 [Arcicella sp.]|nr:hypothetical protein [Arcicella sp.]